MLVNINMVLDMDTEGNDENSSIYRAITKMTLEMIIKKAYSDDGCMTLIDLNVQLGNKINVSNESEELQ